MLKAYKLVVRWLAGFAEDRKKIYI